VWKSEEAESIVRINVFLETKENQSPSIWK
jgi:hypothetical protein